MIPFDDIDTVGVTFYGNPVIPDPPPTESLWERVFARVEAREQIRRAAEKKKEADRVSRRIRVQQLLEEEIKKMYVGDSS